MLLGFNLLLWTTHDTEEHYPLFAELKRSLRELPQLSGLGVQTDQVGAEEDWHGGSRRQHR